MDRWSAIVFADPPKKLLHPARWLVNVKDPGGPGVRRYPCIRRLARQKYALSRACLELLSADNEHQLAVEYGQSGGGNTSALTLASGSNPSAPSQRSGVYCPAAGNALAATGARAITAYAVAAFEIH
jgi:hypothetical protein